MRASRFYSLLAASFLVVFFVVFHAGATHVYFADDEAMNIYGYWNPPLKEVALAHILFWNKFVRPLGALYYLPLYDAFRLNPVPFNIVRSVLLLADTMVFYFLAAWLLRSRWIAFLAALPIAYHAEMGHLAYAGSFIYDIFCGGFFFGAMLYYVRSRSTHGPLGIRQTCIFLALYICALDAKEMAVSLPVIVLAYEGLVENSFAAGPKRWTRLAPALIAGAITLLYIVGKTVGPGALTAVDAYRPVVSWRNFAASNVRFLNTMFLTDAFTMRRVLAAWALLLYLGLRKGFRNRDSRWLVLLVWVVVTPLPVAFIPARGGAQIYIVAAGWAMAVAMGLRALAWRVAQERVLVRIPRYATMTAALAGCAAVYTHETWRIFRRTVPAYSANGEKTRGMIGQLRMFRQPPPGSRVVFLNDPLPEGFGALFISSVLWDDHSLQIDLQRYAHLTPAQIENEDYIFDYVDGKLIQLKPVDGSAPHSE